MKKNSLKITIIIVLALLLVVLFSVKKDLYSDFKFMIYGWSGKVVEMEIGGYTCVQEFPSSADRRCGQRKVIKIYENVTSEEQCRKIGGKLNYSNSVTKDSFADCSPIDDK